MTTFREELQQENEKLSKRAELAEDENKKLKEKLEVTQAVVDELLFGGGI